MASQKCPECGEGFVPKPLGRPPTYCSLKCRQDAYRHRLQRARDQQWRGTQGRLRAELAAARRRMKEADDALNTDAVKQAMINNSEVAQAIGKASKLLRKHT